MKKWNLLVDIDKCNGCFNCFLAVKDEHVGNTFPGYSGPQPLHGHRWIDVVVHERGAAPTVDLAYVPVMCNHCDDAPCVKAGAGAVRKREDGIVIIDPERAKGRKDLVATCPYGAIWWNEEEQVPQHWIFDAHLIDQGWPQPRCAQACGTGAITALKVEDAEMQTLVRRDDLRVLRPELGTNPRVYYRNLHRLTSALVAGTVVAKSGTALDAVVGAHVELSKGSKTVTSTRTDPFGEFRMDVPGGDASGYRLTVTADGLQPAQRSFELTGGSHCTGIIELAGLQAVSS
jgi:Fe-S-cluster-containing dehydrogenase component